MSKNAASDKQPGKVTQIHQLWQRAGLGEPLPRAFAIDLAVARGFNPSAARTQFVRRPLQRRQDHISFVYDVRQM